MIRWRQPGDEAGIVDLVRTELVPLSPRSRIRERQLKREMTDRLGRGVTLVVSKTGWNKPLAFLHMEIRNQTLFIDLLAVDSSVQQRRWGTELMRNAEQYASVKGCTEARLFVDDTNERGLRFYSKLGYFVVRHIPEAKCYEFAKPLTMM